ncbi:MAG: DUF1801 domain-containing protein [Anaeromyxobacteraceae bacterium]
MRATVRKVATSAAATPERRLASFVAKFTPSMAARIRAARRKLRALVPGATELVYDNYNFFVIGFGPGPRPSDAVLSLACQRSGIALCFLRGVGLPDPQGLLRGAGSQVRSIKLEDDRTLDAAPVRALVRAAVTRSRTPFDPKARRALVIRSVSAKQRPRR